MAESQHGEGEGDQGGDADRPDPEDQLEAEHQNDGAARGHRLPAVGDVLQGQREREGGQCQQDQGDYRGEVQPGVLEPHPDDDQDRRPGCPRGRHAPDSEAVRPL